MGIVTIHALVRKRIFPVQLGIWRIGQLFCVHLFVFKGMSLFLTVGRAWQKLGIEFEIWGAMGEGI